MNSITGFYCSWNNYFLFDFKKINLIQIAPYAIFARNFN